LELVGVSDRTRTIQSGDQNPSGYCRGTVAIFASKIALSAGILHVLKATRRSPARGPSIGGPPSPPFAQIAASNGENSPPRYYDPGTLLRSLWRCPLPARSESSLRSCIACLSSPGSFLRPRLTLPAAQQSEVTSLESGICIAVRNPRVVTHLRVQSHVYRAAVRRDVCYRFGECVQNGRIIDIGGSWRATYS
jgi:hypothetical protein